MAVSRGHTRPWQCVAALLACALVLPGCASAACDLPAISPSTNSWGECLPDDAGYWYTDGLHLVAVATKSVTVDVRRREAFVPDAPEASAFEPRLSIQGPGEIRCDMTTRKIHVKLSGPAGQRTVVAACISNGRGGMTSHPLPVVPITAPTRTFVFAHDNPDEVTEYDVEPVSAGFTPVSVDTFRDPLDSMQTADLMGSGVNLVAGVLVRALQQDAFVCAARDGKCFHVRNGGNSFHEVPALPGGGPIWIRGFEVTSGALFASRLPGSLPSNDDGNATLWVMQSGAWVPANPMTFDQATGNEWKRTYDIATWGTTYVKADTVNVSFDSATSTKDASGVLWAVTAKGIATRRPGTSGFQLKGLFDCCTS
eukprot:Opistho-1_new@93590